MKLSDFIPAEGQERIAKAITEAERLTTGEICVHVAHRCRGNVMKRARKVFNKLELYKTLRRNAVLIFIAYDSRKFAILGDVGIDNVVPDNFWDQEKETLAQFLTAGRQVDGICEVIAQVGASLQQYFPGVRDDVNELSNEVTFDTDDDDD